jgi:hypothetical protein
MPLGGFVEISLIGVLGVAAERDETSAASAAVL